MTASVLRPCPTWKSICLIGGLCCFWCSRCRFYWAHSACSSLSSGSRPFSNLRRGALLWACAWSQHFCRCSGCFDIDEDGGRCMFSRQRASLSEGISEARSYRGLTFGSRHQCCSGVSAVPVAPFADDREERCSEPLRASTHDDFRAYA